MNILSPRAKTIIRNENKTLKIIFEFLLLVIKETNHPKMHDIDTENNAIKTNITILKIKASGLTGPITTYTNIVGIQISPSTKKQFKNKIAILENKIYEKGIGKLNKKSLSRALKSILEAVNILTIMQVTSATMAITAKYSHVY